MESLKERFQKINPEIKHNAEEPEMILFRTKDRRGVITLATMLFYELDMVPASFRSDHDYYAGTDGERHKDEGGMITYSKEDGRRIHEVLGLEIPSK